MKVLTGGFLLLALVLQPCMAATVEVLDFDSAAEEQRYTALIDELRCMVCQNQNLADSNAALARDLRERTYKMIRGGNSDQEIVDYMVERYGDFVMYRPPLKSTTYLLWFGPLIFLSLAIVTFFVYARRSRNREVPVLSYAERQKAQQMLDE